MRRKLFLNIVRVFLLSFFLCISFVSAEEKKHYDDRGFELNEWDEDDNNGGGGDNGGGDSTPPSPTNADYEDDLDDIDDEADGVEGDDAGVEEPEETEEEINDAIEETEKDSDGAKKTAEDGEKDKLENGKTNDEEADIIEAPLGGDPVILSEGSYVQNEEDISFNNLIPFSVKRKYSSNNKIISTFGYAWITNLDERIILGVDADCEEIVNAYQQYVDKLTARIPEFENNLAQKYHVENIYNAESEINEKIKRCDKNLSSLRSTRDRANRIYNETRGYGLSIASDINAQINRIQGLMSGIESKKNRLKASLERLPYDLSVIAHLKTELQAARSELRAKQNILNRAKTIRNQNKYVMLQGMEKFYEEIGFESINVIDENGSPHILHETSKENGVWINENEKIIKRCERLQKGYKVSLYDGYEKLYDEGGFLIRITDRNGNYVSIVRNSNEKITSIETSSGEKIVVSYSGNNVSSLVNARNTEESVLYSYQGNRLSAVKDTEGDTVDMKYNTDGYLTDLVKCDGSRVQFVYGEQTANNKVLATITTNEEGYSERFIFNLSSRKTEYINHDNNTTIYEYDDRYRTKRETHPDGTLITNDYDTKGNLTAITENGSITRYLYDDRGNRIKAFYEDGSLEEWTYDNFNLILSYKDRDGNIEEYLRNEKGNLKEYRKNGKTVFTQDFDSKGQVTSFRQFGQKTLATTFAYDSFGNLIKENCDNIEKEYLYDSRNRITETKLNGKTVKKYKYNSHETSVKNYNGLETVYLTNGRKDLVKISQKDTATDVVHETRVVYDRRHLPLAVYSRNRENEEVINSYLYTKEGIRKLNLRLHNYTTI